MLSPPLSQGSRLSYAPLVTARHKLTVHRDTGDGELFDLDADPGEVHNLWHDPSAAGVKSGLLLLHAQARMAEEPIHMPRLFGA
jgi:hypothetical protein